MMRMASRKKGCLGTTAKGQMMIFYSHYPKNHRSFSLRTPASYCDDGGQQLTVLFLILTTLFSSVGGRFGVPAPSAERNEVERGSSFLLLNFSGPQPSDKFIACHFNPGCFCKYDQKTEIYESLRRLWQLSGFNETSYARAVKVLQREIRNDPTTTYFFPESDFFQLAQSALNSSTSANSPLHFQYSYSPYSSTQQRQFGSRVEEPGPIFEFVCPSRPMAVIPTEYNAHGMMTHVSVTGSELGILDGSVFSGLEIQNIQMSRDHLYYISEFAFSSMGNSLTVADFSGNSLDQIPFSSFKPLKVLEWLNINNNLLNSVQGEWFSVADSIRQLSVSGNSLDSLPFNMFPSFGRLMWLDLSLNYLRNLSHTELPPNLQTLILMKNRFQTFPKNIFHLESLSWLILGGCSIDSIPTEWPRGAPALQMNQMDLSENSIQTWPSRPFGEQLMVLDLDIQKNYIYNLPADSFHSMNCFRLSIGFNKLNMIDQKAFATLEHSLQYLNLEGNRLNEIPWKPMENLTSLMHLYVGGNQLTDDAIGLPEAGVDCKLTYIGLNANKLTKVPRRLLSRCPNLQHINLGYNEISYLDDLHLMATTMKSGGLHSHRLKHLQTLVLRNNPIFSLAFSGTGAATSASHLQQRRQSENPSGNGGGGITTDNSVESFMPNDAHLGISSAAYHVLPSIPNVFRTQDFPSLFELSLSFCQLSGELEPFPSLPLTNLEISMGLKSATTIQPTMFQALKNLEWLALDHNSLQTISDYSFYSLRNLSYVNLEFNKIEVLPRQLFHPDIHQSISHLRLSHNKLTNILSDSFLSFPGINVDLSYNSIMNVERNAFSIVPVAAGGSGQRNELTSSSPNEFSAAAQTSSSSGSLPSSLPFFSSNRQGLNLFLNRNKLVMMKPNALAGEKFSLVDLSYNELSSFNFDTFARHTLLGGVNISHCLVDKIVVPKNRRFVLEFLDASYNRIQYRGVAGSLQSICPEKLLDLSHNRLERIDSKMFPVNCSIREINLQNNYITTLDPETFTNLRDLTVLHISHNRIAYVPDILFIRNSKLNYLDLSHNKIRSLPRDSLVGSSIEILSLASNEFVNLPVAALSQISRRLKRVDFSRNAIEHLDSTMFEPISGIMHMNLSQNRLTILPDNVFSNLASSIVELDLSNNPGLRANFKELFHFLPKLKVLRLANCLIRVLPMLPLPNLISLDMSENGMEEISMQSLSSLSRLRVLDVSNNKLASADLPSWTSLANLVTLKMSGNPLRSLTKDTFHGLKRLEVLEILDLGRVTRFDSDVLSHLINLRSLAVETHPNIERYQFRVGSLLSNIPYLEELYVDVKESLLSDQLLGGILQKLRKLTITGSSLSKIEPNALNGLENCFHMDLTITRTGVDDIPPRIFELLQNAEYSRLTLSHNKLYSLDSSYLYPNRSVWFSKGTRLLQGGLVLDGNEFICDCDLVWIGEWLRRWLRESFESHSTAIPLVHSMYEEIRRPTCIDSKGEGKGIPLIELYSEYVCHASALSGANHLHTNPFKIFNLRRGAPNLFTFDMLLSLLPIFLVFSRALQVLLSIIPWSRSAAREDSWLKQSTNAR